MSDYATATGAPRTLRIAGKDYLVPKLRPRDLGELEAWLKGEVPNPKAEARQHMDGLPDAVAIHVWNRALEEARDWPPGIDSERGNQILMASPEGQARLVWVLLRRTNAGLTLDHARDLAEAMDAADFEALSRYASPGDPDDPKSAAAGATSSTTSASAPASP